MAYRRGWKNRLRRLVGLGAIAVVANSQGGVDYWGPELGVRRVIPNGLALQAIRSATAAEPETLGLPADARIVLFAGRMNAEKNVAILLQALDDVLDHQPDCAAVLFGDGPLQAALRMQVDAMRGRERVRLAGFTTELWRWMRRASAFVSVSLFEGNPNTVLEAMAVGCPLVVSTIAQHREILDDTMAQFCDPTSVEEIANAIAAVLCAPELAAHRAATASNAANAWSVESAARAYLDLYRELSSSRNSALGSGSP